MREVLVVAFGRIEEDAGVNRFNSTWNPAFSQLSLLTACVFWRTELIVVE